MTARCPDMAQFKSFGDFASALSKLEADTRKSLAREVVQQMADRAEEIADRYARLDTGGDLEMSGWPVAALEVKVKMARAQDGHAAVLMPYSRANAAGWTVMDRGRNVGETGMFLGPAMTRSGGTVRRRKNGTVAKFRERSAKRWNGVTRPHYTATHAVEQIEREMPVIAGKFVRKTVVKHFDVS